VAQKKGTLGDFSAPSKAFGSVVGFQQRAEFLNRRNCAKFSL
jgi:hypothetical protein